MWKMKQLYLLLYVLFFVTCGSTQIVETDTKEVSFPNPAGPEGVKAEIPPKTAVVEADEFTSKEKIETLMNYLASDELEGRDSGSKGIELAARFIEEYLGNNGVAPYYKTYRDTLSNFRKPAYNIVGVVEGNDPNLKNEYIVIGAHYDHIGTIKPERGDYIANGANDNASGTTTVMEIARYFGGNTSNKRSLIFAFFSAEEKGLLGSKHMAKNMKEDGLNLYTMLNFEMVGVPMKGKDYELFITGYNKSNLAEVSNKYGGENFIGFSRTSREYELFQRSDNYHFYREFRVPSHTYCAFDFTNFAYYHKVGDEVSEMDFEHMTNVVNRMIPVVEGIANAPTQEVKLNK